MFKNVKPEQIGIESKYVKSFIEQLEDLSLATHSVIMCRGNDIFCEAYWKPFDKDFNHRQYSQTKSFVGIAIGLLEEEGKLKLTDKICDHFRDRIKREVPKFLEEQTIEDMLTMRTAVENQYWFREDSNKDRVDTYFNDSIVCRPSGTTWQYDSPGSQVLCALVERLAKKPMLDYLKLKLFNKMDAFKNASILKTPTGESWGDSALLCTPRDMLSVARLLMDKGNFNGEQLINEEYVKKATSPIVADTMDAHEHGIYCGYGYQIWTMAHGAFAFLGMGQQLTFCYPEQDLIFVINSDNQGAVTSHPDLMQIFFDKILKNLKDKPLKDNELEYQELNKYINTLELKCIKGIESKELKDKINGKKFVSIDENKQGIKYIKLSFNSDDTGVLSYKNAQGEKELEFGVNKNVFGRFPQYGYSNDVGGIQSTDNYLYKCATSVAFTSQNQLSIYVQVVDRYFGNLSIMMGFKDDYVTVKMTKVAENFFNEYHSDYDFVAKLEK